jgi:hypothetical protein
LKKLARGILLFACGLCLIPLCVSVSLSTVSLIRSLHSASGSGTQASSWAFGIGFTLWVLLYLLAPRPVRTYVLAHELTHALWALASGERVWGFKLSKDGGRVVVSGNNLLITLAPYFFPLYTVLVIALYFLLSLFWDVQNYELFWMALVGFTWAFHVTFTIGTLLSHQSDVREYGRLLSYTAIYLLNLIGVGFWTIAVSTATVEDYIGLLRSDFLYIWHWIVGLF